MIQSVPLVDLTKQQDQIADAIREGFNRVIAESSFILGPQVGEFEEAWARYCGAAFAVGVGNGTDAIELALRAAGIGRGDEVILPANTFVATAGAVHRAGADIVLADCNEDFLLDPQQVANRVTPRTKAVIGVHLYGQAAPIELIRAAAGPGMVVVEDMAQAQGAERWGQRAGTLGDIAATSFYPGKNLGAYGDAGAVMTSSSEFAERARRLRNHGGTVRYDHPEVGFNSRMDSLQAVVLSAKLCLLDEWNRQRRAAAAVYRELLSEVDGVILPQTASGNEHVHHVYVIRIAERDRVVRELNSAGIGAAIHYPVPIHLLPAYAELGHRPGAFPAAERFAAEILSLPIYPGISVLDQELVVGKLRAALGR
ncbi:DegT/DnrJ/EryC1/StrS family aminotransferase [Arthrobacter sp. H-02-3]|uniref:DegT/DnrJ/EryC1/StrS family aminotransferase n=1 Tax=Arthrobacter sp. H-02-3 TaxID=2703675 RepID=UPI000DD2520D|nr:DegT/DnrJ/EryC1/StrS family aminotransferase [Arthrobacter sp. H-02-3]PVZ57064.1 erythromycin biosynthesis sensory transduction protein eryC1 [Arthrobacter sp. H-02-3]